MGLSTRPTVAAVEDPITRDEAKDHSSIDGTEDDVLVESIIKTATEIFEGQTGRQCVTASWDLTLDAFPCSDDTPIYLPRSPLQSVTSITYKDEDGVSTVMPIAEYEVDATTEPGCIRLAYECEWPATLDHWNAVVIRFVAGYGLQAAVPADVKMAVKALFAHLWENREPISFGGNPINVPFQLQGLIDSLRVPFLP